jgi:3-hydroxyisobutyrate dehydrogenase-like beta-hydroxyacid dehydrogenase
MSVVGVIGLGAMGGRFAGRLLEVGHEVYGTNRDACKAQPLIARGPRWHDTAGEVASAADVVLSMVADDRALEAGREGTSP